MTEPQRFCLAVLRLEELSWEAQLPHGFSPVCSLEWKHSGPHEALLNGRKFGYTARIWWYDAFPDLVSPLDV